MPTTMTGPDWHAAVALFRASLPRRGVKSRKVSTAMIASAVGRVLFGLLAVAAHDAASPGHVLGFVRGLFAA